MLVDFLLPLSIIDKIEFMTEKELMQQRVDELIKMTNEFCVNYIDEEYAGLCKKMIEKLGRKRSVKPLATGRLNIWAAAVVYTIATNNFLFDKSFKPYIPSSTIHEYFDTKQSTVSAKSALIRQTLKLSARFDPEYSTEKTIENNPFLMIQNMNGFWII